jgi:PAS domain S-box-containing protein
MSIALTSLLDDGIHRSGDSIKSLSPLSIETRGETPGGTSFQFLVENVLDIITELDVKGTILYESPSVMKLLGYRPEELQDTNVWSYIHPLDIPRVMPVFMLGLLTPGVPRSVEFRFRHINGSWVWLECVGKSYNHAEFGRRIVVTSRAVHESSPMKASVGDTEIGFERVVEGLGEGLLITDLEDNILYVNGRMNSLVGYGPDEMLGKKPYELLLLEEHWPAYQEFKRKWLCGEAEHCEIPLVRKDKTMAWFYINVTPYLGLDGEPLGIQAALADISEKKLAEEHLQEAYQKLESHVTDLNREIAERKLVEQELIASKNKAEEMNRLKTAFLANMSHEIRTPMTSILGFASILSESLEGTELSEFSAMIEKGGRRLMDTINSILDMAKIEANKIELKLAQVDVHTEIRKTIDLLRPLAIQKGIALSLNVREAGLTGMTDEHYLGRILTNVIGNAVKFTEHGSVSICLDRWLRREEGSAWDGVTIAITDTGIGISPEFLPHVFDEFKQESSGFARNYEGTGLGLSLSKSLVELLGGNISVESKQGQGTCFTISLPLEGLRVFEKSNARTTNAANLRGARPRILLVEDNYETARLVRLFLDTLADVDHATDPQSAYRQLEQAQFDLVLMDVNLRTEKDGLELTAELKQDPRYKNIPVVAVTAYAMKGDRERAIEAGCVDHVAKPFTRSELVTAVHANVKKSAAHLQAA